MGFRHFRLFIVLCGLVLLASCGRYEKIKRSNDVNYKLTMANKYFDKKDYLHANELYRDLMPVMKGTKNFEAMLYKFAMSFFMLKNYHDASYYFKFYTDLYPQTQNADEAAFMHAYAIYKMSPRITVMQTNTEKALEVLQEYVSKHPDSKHVTEANSYIAITQVKLEEKAALAARLYYDISQYKAATVVYRNIQTDFPMSDRMDEYQYMIVKSNYKYARASAKEKQEERFVNVLSAYQELVDTYPQSKYIKEAEKYFTLATVNIQKLKK